jgi:hypothetical protein
MDVGGVSCRVSDREVEPRSDIPPGSVLQHHVDAQIFKRRPCMGDLANPQSQRRRGFADGVVRFA